MSKVNAKLEPEGFQWNVKNTIGIAASMIGLFMLINFMFLRIGFADEEEVPSIAILPFENKGAEDDEFYAYGISSDLISDVASAGLIRVASLKEIEELGDLNFKEKAKRLLVRYVAQGTIWKRDSIFQLAMELYDTKTEKVLWSERWQKNWKEIPQIRDLLSENILKKLSVDYNTDAPSYVSNPEAYEYYLKARHKYAKRKNKDDIGKVYISYATHYWQKNDLETAVEYDKKSLKLYEELGDLKGVAINLVGVGIYYSSIKKDY
jgi:TolB-like protein